MNREQNKQKTKNNIVNVIFGQQRTDGKSKFKKKNPIFVQAFELLLDLDN